MSDAKLYEHEQPGEAAQVAELIEILKGLIEKPYLTGTTYRDTHAKGHAIVRAEFTVHDNLPEELRVGLFATPKTYEAWVRMSNLSPTPQDDKKGDIRALAIKLYGVEGDTIWKNEEENTLDFIMMGSGTFLAPDLPTFIAMEKALLKGGLAVPWFFLTHPAIAMTILKASKPCPNLLQKAYYSQTAYAFGDRVVQYHMTNLTPATAKMPAKPTPNFLRERLAADLSQGEASFDFCVQFQTNPVKMPVENPMVPWKESESPYRPVATLRLLRQNFDAPRQMALCENVSYNPWRTLKAHAPLGSINRARLAVYPAISEFRHKRNAAPVLPAPLPSSFEEPGPVKRIVIPPESAFSRLMAALSLKALIGLIILLVLFGFARDLWDAIYPPLPAPVQMDYTKAVYLNEPDFSVWPADWKAAGSGYPGSTGSTVPVAAEIAAAHDSFGWTGPKDASDWWHHTAQGSLIMPYKWFINLEQYSAIPFMPSNFDSFFEADNLTKFRLIPDTKNRYNPDGLPFGFVMTPIPDPVTGEQFVGVTCSACHTGQMTYKGQLYIIEGGAGMLDTVTTLQVAINSLLMTASPIRQLRWHRFAKRVLGDSYTWTADRELKKQVLTFLAGQLAAQFINPGPKTVKASQASKGGYGRIDALNTGGNVLFGMIDKANLVATNANVTIPPLWDAYLYDWVQLNGSIRSPLARNSIEGMAVGAYVDLYAKYGPQYGSTAAMINMQNLEEWHSYLKPPVWPSAFPPIDQSKVAHGRDLYVANCAYCHARICTEWVGAPPPTGLYPSPDPVSKRWNFATYHLRTFDPYQLGTDPTDALDFANRTVVGADKVAGLGVASGQTVPGYQVIAPVIGGMISLRFKELGLSNTNVPDVLNQQQEMLGYRDQLWSAPPSYPARPLSGVWSTAPYLHNGSVPNLDELLQPAANRSKVFYVGALEFDPVKVGYDQYKPGTQIKNTFEYETSKVGNQNSGHEYGTTLAASDRAALIEYLKALKPEDEDWDKYFPNAPWPTVFAGAQWTNYVKPSKSCGVRPGPTPPK